MKLRGNQCGVSQDYLAATQCTSVLVHLTPHFLIITTRRQTMPKHGLTFKHFLGSRPGQKHERKERSVNELLSSSRQAMPPSIDLVPVSTSTSASASLSTATATSTSTATGASGAIPPPAPAVVGPRDRPPHMWGSSEDAVHP